MWQVDNLFDISICSLDKHFSQIEKLAKNLIFIALCLRDLIGLGTSLMFIHITGSPRPFRGLRGAGSIY